MGLDTRRVRCLWTGSGCQEREESCGGPGLDCLSVGVLKGVSGDGPLNNIHSGYGCPEQGARLGSFSSGDVRRGALVLLLRACSKLHSTKIQIWPFQVLCSRSRAPREQQSPSLVWLMLRAHCPGQGGRVGWPALAKPPIITG
jgi:hypothetical protein